MTPLCIFVATRREDVPAGCARYISVDGSVPGASVVWDHHMTGERINLDAMPEVFALDGFDGIGTTLADMDAVASVVAALHGGKARLPRAAREVLEAASCWCDHLARHPAHDAETNRLGRGLLDVVAERLAGPPDRATARFADACRLVDDAVRAGGPLPFADRFAERVERARALIATGRVRHDGGVVVVDKRGQGGIDPAALLSLDTSPVAVWVDDHKAGGLRYTVGVNPNAAAPPDDVRPALRALAAAEFAHGAPALAATPGTASENWGGRQAVFGSPWNYGSRLAPDEVVRLTRAALGV